MPESTRFFVAGLPAPGGSKRGYVVGKRAVIVDANPRAKPWMARVAAAASDHFAAPLSGPLHVSFTFVMPRPKGHFGERKGIRYLKPSAPAYPAIRPDTTKLVRSTEDAMSGIAYEDDGQIVQQHGAKVYGARPGAWIEVSRMGDAGP